MSPSENYAVHEYLDADGRCPYAAWFEKLPAATAAKVAIAVTRMALGNLGDSKSVGDGVHERRIDTGPGYRIYFGRGRGPPDHFPRRRHQESAGAGHRESPGPVA